MKKLATTLTFGITMLFICLSQQLSGQAGVLDLSFGDEGIVTTDFDGYIGADPSGIAIQSDGKIILSGVGANGSDFDVIAARYLPDGTLDTAFGIDGRFTHSMSDLMDLPLDLGIDKDDNIFLCGFTFDDIEFENKGFLMKLRPEGSLDTSFAQNGVMISQSFNTDDSFDDLIVMDDGRVMVAGNSRFSVEPNKILLGMVNLDGSLDATFGTNGYVTTSVPATSYTRFVGIDFNQRIVVGGYNADMTDSPFLARFDMNGTLDTLFGNEGIVIADNNSDEKPYAMAIQQDNKIVVCAPVWNNDRDFGMLRFNEDGTLEYDYAIARYDTDGRLDPSFGNGGRVITDFKGYDDVSLNSMLQPDGKLLCSGYSKKTPSGSSFSMARFSTSNSTRTEEIKTPPTLVNIYPNPSNGSFHVSRLAEGDISDLKMEILDSKGQVLHVVRDAAIKLKTQGNILLDKKKELDAGTYFLKMETLDGIQIEKVVVVK